MSSGNHPDTWRDEDLADPPPVTLAPELIHGKRVVPVVMADGLSSDANDCARCVFVEEDDCLDILCTARERDDRNEVYFMCAPAERYHGKPLLDLLKTTSSDGSTASYYELPTGATELQDLISFRNMNAQMGEVGRAWYRYGQCPHSPKMRELKKMKFYIDAEIARLEKYGD